MVEKEELTLEEAREELGKWQEILVSWPKLSSTEKFSHYYQASRLSEPFVDKSISFSGNPQLTEKEEAWNKVLIDVVYFRRALEKLWKVKSEETQDVIEKAKETLRTLLAEYDNYMAGE